MRVQNKKRYQNGDEAPKIIPVLNTQVEVQKEKMGGTLLKKIGTSKNNNCLQTKYVGNGSHGRCETLSSQTAGTILQTSP